MDSASDQRCDVFISYTRLKDLYGQVSGFREHFENELRQKTGDAALTVFRDTEMEPGRIWRHELEEKMKLARLLLILLSPTWLKSEECLKEFRFFKQVKASNSEKIIVPLVWDDPTHVRLNEDQRKELTEIRQYQMYPVDRYIRYADWTKSIPNRDWAVGRLAQDLAVWAAMRSQNSAEALPRR